MTKGLRRRLRHNYREFESRLDGDQTADGEKVNKTYVSTTDPDAAIIRRKKGAAKPTYKVHRAVDIRSEIITAAEVTSGDINEGHMLSELIDKHGQNTQKQAEVVIADSQYGTARNYLGCLDRGIEAHIPSMKKAPSNGIFSEESFVYDPQDDTYLCPAGNRLKCSRYKKRDTAFEYRCLPGLCKACSLRDQCTTSKSGRTIQRHIRHDEIELMRQKAQEPVSKKDIRTRQHLMERSFARAVRLGFKRSRWRRLWRVQIQEYLTAAIQNILVLVQYVKEPRIAKAVAMHRQEKWPHTGADTNSLIELMRPSVHLLGAWLKPFSGKSRWTLRSCFRAI